jgi:3-polyprenyl-4-hydroxybenzoate decarboxylase
MFDVRLWNVGVIIRNMETVTLAGASVLPSAPAFHHHPKTIDDLLNQIAGKSQAVG